MIHDDDGEEPTTNWVFPNAAELPPGQDFIGVGADLRPGTLLAAYRSGYFPMPVVTGIRKRSRIGWFSPDPRGTLPLDGLIVSRSLRRSIRRYRVTIDTCFDQVIAACADPARPHGWIDDDITTAYRELHRLGYAHSVETWDGDVLVGGLYGVATGGLFAGESMFHRRTDASKVALVHLVDLLNDGQPRLLDVQWQPITSRRSACKRRRGLIISPCSM
ncbi:MAG: leucyl/phenylalanyl-tRNA--protein transferase [Acidimicrobiales bacterium]